VNTQLADEPLGEHGIDCRTHEEGFESDVRDDFEYGTFYEIEDRKHHRIFYVVEGCRKILGLREKRYPYDTMYDFLMYNDIPGCADPISDYKFWRPQLIELATYRTMEVNHARKGNSKYIARGIGGSPDSRATSLSFASRQAS
jgi:hypothetical protein